MVFALVDVVLFFRIMPAKWKFYTLPFLLFAIGTAVSLLLLWWLIQLQREKIAHDFSRVASDRSEAVARRISDDFLIPESVRQLFDASDFVDEKEFRTYVRPILQRMPELDSVTWTKRVVDGEGKTSYPILYRESQAVRENSRKLDGLPGLGDAIEVSVRTGNPKWLNLDNGQEASGWLVVLPMFDHEEPANASMGDKKSASGVLLAQIDLDRLLKESFFNLEKVGMDAVIYDGEKANNRVLARWYSVTRTAPYDALKEKSADRYGYVRAVGVGENQWMIYCRPAPHFLEHYQWWEQGFIFVGCLIMSGLCAVYLLRQRLSESEMRRQNETIGLLENIAVAANEVETNEVLLTQSLKLICEYMGWPFGHVYVEDELRPGTMVSSGIFQITDEARHAAMREMTKQKCFAKGEGLPGVVSLSGGPIFIPNVHEYSDFRRGEGARNSGLYACFAFPVLVRKKVAVVVEFFHTEVTEPFAGWRELLSSISTQMSHAMERHLAADELMEKTAVLENAAEGIARVDPTGVYLSVNKAYARMCGLEAAELIGKNGREMVHPDDHVIFKAAYDQMLEQGRAEAKGRRMRTDGAVYYQELTMIRDDDRKGKYRGCYLFSRDVTEREEQQRALRESEERFMAFMLNNPASAAIKDEESRLIYLNPAATNLFRLNFEEVLGKTPEELFGAKEAEIIRSSDQALLKTNQPVNLVEVIPDRSGRLKHWLVYKFPMKGREGKRLIGVLALDISERMEAEKAILAARDEALESARMKSQFLANMSHEIRTPMNGLIGMLGLLGRTELQVAQRELLQTASSASDSLLRLLNDILDFSKIEAGKLEIDPISFDPRQCLRHAVKILAEPARKKGLTLTFHIADDVPEFLYGDSGRLSQIFVNLLNNGIKFTPQGSVNAHLAVERRLENGRLLLHCVVRDTGIGVQESHRDIIFQPFRQSDSSTSRQYGGTGLGLAICSQLAGLMGGKIWIESEPAGGSAFHFTVQMEEVEMEETRPVTPANQVVLPCAEQSLRILLAEDNEINQQLAMTLLRERGHYLVLARDGYEAVAHFQKSRFDLILMDVQMPGKDGYQATIDIRNDPRGKTIPIYALTAHAMPEDRRRCHDAGMNDYLTKPIRVDEFARLVEAKVQKNRSFPLQAGRGGMIKTRRIDWQPTRIAVVQPSQIRHDVVGMQSLDLPALRQLVNNNETLILQLATSFTKQALADREQMRISLQEHDRVRLESAAHRLKGSALSLSASPLARIVQSLETSARANDFEGANAVWEDFETAFETLVSELETLRS